MHSLDSSTHIQDLILKTALGERPVVFNQHGDSSGVAYVLRSEDADFRYEPLGVISFNFSASSFSLSIEGNCVTGRNAAVLTPERLATLRQTDDGLHWQDVPYHRFEQINEIVKLISELLHDAHTKAK